MLTRPLIAFDIETVPDPDFGRRALGFEGDNAAVIEAMTSRRLEETEGRTQYPSPPLHRIVTIAAARLDLDGGSFEVDTLGGEAWDEKSHLEGFARLFHDTSRPPRLVSWNGNGFDLPVIRYRAMLHGVPLPALYRTDGEWKWNNYQSRYHDMHVDLMDVLAGYGASRWVGLGQMCDLLGVPSKEFIEGEVYENILRGDEELVREYCKLDVVSTILVFLSWLVQRGDLEAASLSDSVEGIRQVLAQEEFEGWRAIAEGLRGWPTYAPLAGNQATGEEDLAAQVDVDAVRAFMHKARDCAMEMFKNALYIQGELPKVEIPDALRATTKEVCSEMIGTKHDIISELAELEDVLGGRPTAKKVAAKTNRIVAWLGDDIQQLHELVAALHAAQEQNESHSLGWVLVAESAANIVDAFGATMEAAGEIDAVT